MDNGSWENSDGKEKQRMKERLLILEDGHVFEGEGFGADTYQMGELVFNTGMMGYQEILTDASYYGQIVMMTYPMIGNYGINRDDFESVDPAVFGLVVGEYCQIPHNWRSEMSLNEFMTLKNIPGICNIDTRELTKIIRKNGTMKAIMADKGADVAAIIEQLKQTDLSKDQVSKVSINKPFQIPNHADRVVLIDLGSKNGIIRELNLRQLDIVVVPYNTSAEDILALSPDGIMISDGPGNPDDVSETIETLKKLIGKVPMFGISMGYQLLAKACGAKTYKLKFGHRGSNHPVIDLASGQSEITAQNHSYAVEEESLKGTGLIMTHKALNDNSVQGIKHEAYAVFGVQYHPQSIDSEHIHPLYDQFYQMIEAHKEVR